MTTEFKQNYADFVEGMQEAASEVGVPHTLYRPVNPNATDNPVGIAFVINAAINAAFPRDYKYTKVVQQQRPDRIAIIDPSAIEAGDYLINNETGQTFFISAIPESFMQIVVYPCNTILTASIRTPQAAAGNLGDVGDNNTSRTNMFTEWPACLISSGRGDSAVLPLPGDLKAGQFTVFFPVNVPAPIHNGMQLLETYTNRKLNIISSELSQMGYKLMCSEVIV